MELGRESYKMIRIIQTMKSGTEQCLMQTYEYTNDANKMGDERWLRLKKIQLLAIITSSYEISNY